ncbi:MAG: DUF2291 family protein [Sedimentisphaerales bacterium]|nr:DUF2291 family protein [Sedimentisphaerales bacterium]
MNRPVSSRWIPWFVVCCIIGGLLVVFPPFRMVSLDLARENAQAQAFNPHRFAVEFWHKQLIKSFDNAFEAEKVFDAMRRDRKAAKEQYARVVGLGGPHHYFLKGAGKVITVGKREVELSLVGNDVDGVDVVLVISMIFGNEVLNATGLVSRSQFPRTNDFNAISAEVNKIVETEIVPGFLEKAEVGSIVYFVGCSLKISDDDPIPIPMRLVPVKLEVE